MKWLKWVEFFVIVLVAVGLDQWSKEIASDRLANERAGGYSHLIELTVPEAYDDRPLVDYLSEEFEANTAEEVEFIANAYVRTEGGVDLDAATPLEAGQRLEVTHRRVTVIPGYWDFDYARNPGAAFGLLADSESPWRIPFFVVVSLIAVVVVIFTLRKAPLRDQLLIIALAFVAGGAIGNFIDRISYGYVIDFIVWKYTSEYRWPTFNIADAFISVGVAMLMLVSLRDWWRERKEEKGQERAAG